MITRDIIRELAEFHSPENDAITFYYQPGTPADKSHRQEVIQLKDMVKDAMRRAERSGKNGTVRSDLERILSLAERLHGNSGKAKAIFACSSKGLWREEDVPPRLSGSRLLVNKHFHVSPLANLSDSLEKVCIALVDRSKARFFEMHMDEITEQEGFVDELPRRGRSDGFAGFDGGHAERRYDNEAMNHFKRVADRLVERHGSGGCDRLLVGTRDEIWPGIERQLHPYVKQKLVAHFNIDPAAATAEELRKQADEILRQHRNNERQELLAQVLDEARANNNGSLGLKRVLRSLEQGEIQTLVIGDGFHAEGVECTNCGHLDMRLVESCAVCGQKTREISDITDALVGRALRAGIDIVHVGSSGELQKSGNIGALLRFRAERSVGGKLA
jgi:peptide subunit release factor 1 (eRF1)